MTARSHSRTRRRLKARTARATARRANQTNPNHKRNTPVGGAPRPPTAPRPVRLHGRTGTGHGVSGVRS